MLEKHTVILTNLYKRTIGSRIEATMRVQASGDCSRCGGKMFVVDSYPCVETWQCEQCGFMNQALFDPSPPDPHTEIRKNNRDDRYVNLSAAWLTRPSKKEIYYLRRVVPKLREFSLEQTVGIWEHEGELPLGLFQLQDAIEIEESGRRLGLPIVRKELE